MELIPIQGLGAMQTMQPMDTSSVTAVNTDSASFIDIFRGMVDNVIETNEQVDRDAIDIMLGNIDDLAAVQANIAKANTAVELLTTVKNEVISAYSTIINMQV
ncbi:MAG: flagellar hook-basal body complex protein FliE [Oscillospiraceae bacterium]